MTALVACETVLLVLLTLLVAGLLRSHAEILRRLHDGDPRNDFEARGPSGTPRSARSQPTRRAGERAHDIAGVTPNGDAIQLALTGDAPPTLLAFLTSGCGGCGSFWRDLDDPARRAEVPTGTRLAIVTHDSTRESPARVAELAGAGLPVLMSERAWSDYAVPVTPYMVFVEPAAGRIVGQGTAESWSQLIALMRGALADAPLQDVDAALAAAGIAAGHPSLYPNGRAHAGEQAGVGDGVVRRAAAH